jgi:outer membrane immunogenic protein
MRQIVSLIAGAAALLATTGAYAADMPVKAAERTLAPVFSWTGFYAGVNLGYGWARTSSSSAVAGSTVIATGTYPGTGNLNGINGGGQVGFNYQMGNIVWGIEADFQGSDQKQTTTLGCGVGCTVSEEDRLRSFGTVRGRVGVAAWDRGLLYFTGGWAWMNANSRVTATSGAATATLIDMSASKGGWTIGGGGEWMFAPNWSTKLEYLYMRADNVTATGTIPAVLGGGTIASSSRIENSVVRLGLNYHFGVPR